MAVKQQAFKFVGMQLDQDVSVLNQQTEGGQFLFSAKNIRFITDESNSLFAITNEKGTRKVTVVSALTPASSVDVPSSREIPIGTAVLEDELILFTVEQDNTTNPSNSIYDIYWDQNTQTLKSLRLYNGFLGMDENHPLDTKVSVDTELKKKVYWIDGIHCPRVINVAELKNDANLRALIQGSNNSTVFDSVKTDLLALNSVNIQKTYGAGSFPSGTLQYIITYIDFNGVETAPVYTSSIYYTSPTSDRAGEKDEICKNTFTLTIKNIALASYYKYLRVYSITKTSKEENGLGRLVKEFLLKDAEIEQQGGTSYKKVQVIDLNEGEEFDVSQLLYLGSQYIMPKTFEIKDNAMFFGNYDLKSIDRLDVKLTSSNYTLGQLLAKHVHPTAKLFPYYSPQLDYSTGAITSFKTNQHYRLGIVFTDALNNQSDVVYLDNSITTPGEPDMINTDYQISNGIPFCLFSMSRGNTQSERTEFDNLKALIQLKKWKYATPVVVYPREDDKEIVCQGYLNPTVYNPINRRANIVTHSSWLFRFIPPRNYGTGATKTNCDKIVPEFRHNKIINNVCKYKGTPYIWRYGSSETNSGNAGYRDLHYTLNSTPIQNIKGLEFSSFPIADYRHVWEGTGHSWTDTYLKECKWWRWNHLPEPGKDGSLWGFGFVLPSLIWSSYFYWPDTRKIADSGAGSFRRSRLKNYSDAVTSETGNIGYRWTYLDLNDYIVANPSLLNEYYDNNPTGGDSVYDKLGGVKNFYITDNNLVTLNSPDTELSENLIGINYNNSNIRYVGALNIDKVTTVKSLLAASQTAFNSYTEEKITTNDYLLTFPRLFNVVYGQSAYVTKPSHEAFLKDDTGFTISHNFVISPIHSLKMNFPLNMYSALYIKGNKRGDFKPTMDGEAGDNDSEGTAGTLVTSSMVLIKTNRLSHYFECNSCYFEKKQTVPYLTLKYNTAIYSSGDTIEKLGSTTYLYEASLSGNISLDSSLSTCIYNDDIAIEYDKHTGAAQLLKYDLYYIKIFPQGNILPIDYWSGKHLLIQLGIDNGKELLPLLKTTNDGVLNKISSYSLTAPTESTSTLQTNWEVNDVTLYGENMHQPIIHANNIVSNIDKGIVWLGELTKRVTNQYGGTSQEALINNKWERAGYTVLVTNLADIKWIEGDCFYDTFRSLKACMASDDAVNNTTDVVEFKCESWTNPNSVTTKLKNLKDVTTRNKDNFNLYNEIYSEHSSYKPYMNLTEDDFKSNSFPKQVTVTNSKLINDTVDEWAHITVAAVIDMFNDSHAISKLCNFGDLLYVFLDHNIDTILYGTNVMISTESNTPIELGKSSKVEGSNKVANFGCLNKYAIGYTNNAIYFIETETGLLYLLAQLPANITLAKGMSTWFASHKHSIDDIWLPKPSIPTRNNYKLLFDKLNEELCITDKNYSLSLSDKVNLTFTSFYSYNGIPYLEVISNHNLMIDSSCGFWFKNEGDYNKFFDSWLPYSIEFIANAEYPLYKTFTTINYAGDEFHLNGSTWELNQPNSNGGVFKEITVSNEYLSLTSAVSVINTSHRPSSLKEKFRTWGINIPRSSLERRDRFSNPWIKILLSKDPLDNIKIKLHNLTVNYIS